MGQNEARTEDGAQASADCDDRDTSIRTIAEFRRLDDGEILEGYLDGVHGAPAPVDNRSRSYWHGWRNGMIDRGAIAPDACTLALRRAFEHLRTG